MTVLVRGTASNDLSLENAVVIIPRQSLVAICPVTFTVCVQNQGLGRGHVFMADFCGNKH